MPILDESLWGVACLCHAFAGVTEDEDAAIPATDGLRLVGYCVRETKSPAARAAVRLVYGEDASAGWAFLEVEIAPDASEFQWFWPGISCDGGLSLVHLAGTFNVALYTVTVA